MIFYFTYATKFVNAMNNEIINVLNKDENIEQLSQVTGCSVKDRYFINVSVHK
jgi:uncharacterized protein YejL (UPF0352 family)